jgi:hypothetical protein
MTTDNHPITPPPELIAKWAGSMCGHYEAARWGADEELKACCEWLHWQNLATHSELIPSLRAARRPKPPSLKERALKILEEEPEADDMKELIVFDTAQVEIIRRALKSLPD